MPISLKYSQIKKNDNELLTIEDFNKLLFDITSTRRRYYLSERMIEWDLRNRQLKTDYTESVKIILNACNNFREFTFKLDKSSMSLTLTGKNLKSLKLNDSFGSSKSLLRYLPLKKITLKDTKVDSLKDLSGLHYLESLDLSDNQMKSLDGLQELSSLKELLIKKGHYSAKELKQIPESINVILLQ
jgi:Leucine-rich repeat (LRR) protein